MQTNTKESALIKAKELLPDTPIESTEQAEAILIGVYGIETVIKKKILTKSIEYYKSIPANALIDFSVMDYVKKVKPDLEIVGNVCRDEAINVIKEYNNKFIEEDNKFIDMAIDISKTAYYPFGAIVVRNGKIIGKSTDNTPIKNTLYTHAELIAIESAVSNIKDSISRGNLHQCTLYTSCEPCMMCMEAILSEGISRVVYAATIEDSIEYFCDEFAVPFEEIVKKSNCKIKIIPELHRDKAIEVLKKHGRL